MDERIRNSLDYIEQHLSEKMTLKSLTKKVHLSASQYHRIFRRVTGSTPFKFIERLKMERAYQYLINEEIGILTLSDLLGYRDYETFSRAFKKHHYVSPDDLKAIAQQVHVSANSKEHLPTGEMIVLTLGDISTEAEILTCIKKFITAKKISLSKIEDARVFKIGLLSDSREKSKTVIKNKFELTEEKKLWKQLIESTDS